MPNRGYFRHSIWLFDRGKAGIQRQGTEHRTSVKRLEIKWWGQRGQVRNVRWKQEKAKGKKNTRRSTSVFSLIERCIVWLPGEIWEGCYKGLYTIWFPCLVFIGIVEMDGMGGPWKYIFEGCVFTFLRCTTSLWSDRSMCETGESSKSPLRIRTFTYNQARSLFEFFNSSATCGLW